MGKRIITIEKTDDFKKYLVFNEKSNATIEKYIRDIQKFLEYNNNEEITKEKVIAYKEYLKEKYTVSSINSMLVSLNSYFSFLDWYDLKVKLFKKQQKIFCAEERELTKTEYIKLCQIAESKNNERLSLIMQTICAMGIRVSELQYITVEAVNKGEAIISLKSKTRFIFIVKKLKKKLLDYANKNNIKSGMIFITKKGKAINRINIWREMKKLCKEANINPQKVYPHNLRHLFARVFYSKEKDIVKLADILGHSSINTTRIYIVSTGSEHRQRMENMHLIL
ncbi:MAG: tyrosine-type recombinase/integrase [Erysipelotrichia bacterium]|nr:tyrosine-type recombinase/integrase [Erysipelotrichia bacterium]